jgi:hypothetical protein
MAEAKKIKKKVQILPKNAVGFSFNEKIKITLTWGTRTDLDLCAFFKTKEGQVGGVFSNEYRGRKSDLGFLDKFPFIKHSGDQKEPIQGAISSEEIKIAKLDDMDTVYLCIVNFTAALDELSVTFNEHSGKLELLSDLDDQDNLEIDIDSTDEGPVYYIGNITKDGDTYMLYNECKVMDLGDACEEIPGFSLITR